MTSTSKAHLYPSHMKFRHSGATDDVKKASQVLLKSEKVS
jgi:hypothetical protein